MTTASTRLYLAEYLAYSNGSDPPNELVDGELVPIGLGTGEHGRIMSFLEAIFRQQIQQLGQDWIAEKGIIAGGRRFKTPGYFVNLQLLNLLQH
ncbi:MAG: hypothetical protein HC921_08605 [Synechococcaceae cyanobacterium SM2_3_1]|nr:hypothetical protein [Synechococcaceae cyanobacterium SM2_3_1]